MKLYFDSEKAKEIAQKIIDKHNEDSEQRTRVHLSDTCYCPLRVFHRLIGFPKTQDDSGAGIMITGTMGQLIIQALYPPEWSEYESEFIPSHVDVMEFINDNPHPMEVKFTTRVISTSSEIPVAWVRQLMRYLAIHDSDYGWFLIMNLRTRRFSAWKMSMEAEERAKLREWLKMFEAVILEGKRIYEEDPTEEGYQKAVTYIFEHLPMEMTMNQVKDCSYCGYKKSRKRERQGIDKNCQFSITKRDLS